MRKPRVLFVCIGNSARSQMAEAWLRKLASDRFEPLSAGTHPIGVHPLTIETMREVGADISDARSKGVADLPGPFEHVVTTCAEAEADCPNLRGTISTEHWHVPDPVGRAALVGNRAQGLEIFRRARDTVERQVRQLLKKLEKETPAR